MGFLVSPGVDVKEIDLTNIIPAVSTSIGAYAGAFKKGPIGVATLVGSEKELADIFGAPSLRGDSVINESFLTAASFLKYGNALWVSRILPEGAVNNANSGGATALIKNESQFEELLEGTSLSGAGIWARSPGAIGNSLQVIMAHSSRPFTNANHAALFDNTPNTSTWANTRLPKIELDELNIVVLDKDGKITGTAGTVLETFAGVSIIKDAKKDDGSSNYVGDVIFKESKYIYIVAGGFGNTFFDTQAVDPVGGGTAVFGMLSGLINANGAQIINVDPLSLDFTLNLGNDGNVSSVDDSTIIAALQVFNDAELIDINLIFAQALPAQAEHLNVINEIKLIVETRKDCVGFVSPHKGHAANATLVKSEMDAIGSSSYLVMDSSHVYVYNKYADEFLYIPACGHVAGLCARTDDTNDPWFSPAGFNRGQLQGVIKPKLNPTQAERDLLYKARINPIVAFPGQGIILFGDKTAQTKPSAFDRINVRRLFITLEKAISTSAKFQLFELNDEFTRALFRNMVEPFLRDVQGRRGVTDFLVVCDETNNTGEVIDSNRFVADIYIKPARSINFITLNFIATRTGVEFSEIVGQA